MGRRNVSARASGEVFHGERASRNPTAADIVAPRSAAATAPITALASRPGRRHPPTPAGTPNAIAAERDGVHDPERQLWCAVIIHTLYEAAGRVSYAERGEHDGVRREAIAWFEDAGEDFQAVCELAGLTPDAVRSGALRAIDGGGLPRMRISKAG